MIVQIIIAAIFVVAGLFFLAVSTMGLIRLPDFYTRCHAVGKSETLGSMLVLFGLAVFQGWDFNSIKLLMILIFIGVVNPTATHIIAQAAFRSKLEPWVSPGSKIRDDKGPEDRSGENQPPRGGSQQ
ncbi:MAG TPA: monovalent cation/H(+) antiporter subunit G [Dehalococcoidales bacterium]|nr:monovalent cation/H(+) antiporter subunit G [Dehalococcoidales bacterium]